MSDFEDDEDFGLREASDNPLAAEAVVVEGEDEDIYGDIEGTSAISYSATNAKAIEEIEHEVLKLERQNSGKQSGSSQPAAKATPVGSGKQPARQATDTASVYVGELHWWTTDADLERICAEYGAVESVSIVEEKSSGKSKGHAVVHFRTKSAATLCCQQMSGREINGKKCFVAYSGPSKPAAKMGGRGQQSSTTHHGRGQSQSTGRSGSYGRPSGWNQQLSSSAPMPPLPPWPGMPMMMMPRMGANVAFMPPNLGYGNQPHKRPRF